MLAFKCLIILLAFVISPIYGDATYGADCLTPDGEIGTCVPVTSCKNAMQLLLNIKSGTWQQSDKDFLRHSQCGNIGKLAYFCCRKEQLQINSQVMEHLQKMDCGSFGGTRVSRGENASLYDYRWMALLVSKGQNPFLCGGSLIDDQHILTAAHCLRNNPVSVRLGEYNMEKVTDCAYLGGTKVCLEPFEDIPIEATFKHPNYVSREIHDDIALIRLKRPIKCKSNMRPVCLPITESLKNTAMEYYFIAGWGNTEENVRSSILKYAKIPKQDHEFCLKKLSVELDGGQICAGGKKLQDTCKGDSGGPIFYPTTYATGQERFIQYGIVSAGQTYCGKKNVPGIYTNIVPYMQWITDHMVLSTNPDESNCYVPEYEEMKDYEEYDD